MKRPGMLHTTRWLAILLLTAVAAASALLFAAPAHAAGDTLALSLTNGASFTYGGTAPNFTAVVTFETKPTANYGWLVYVTIEGGETFGSVNQPSKSADGMTLTFTGLRPNNPVAVGQRSATARFLNPGTGVTVYSAPSVSPSSGRPPILSAPSAPTAAVRRCWALAGRLTST